MEKERERKKLWYLMQKKKKVFWIKSGGQFWCVQRPGGVGGRGTEEGKGDGGGGGGQRRGVVVRGNGVGVRKAEGCGEMEAEVGWGCCLCGQQ